MPTATTQSPRLSIEPGPIPTWFGIGGGADRYCAPQSPADLRRCLETDPNLLILGEGANLLVDDDGVADLVIDLSAPAFTSVTLNPKTGAATVGAGADLSKLVVETVRLGLSGLEGLGGIPATLGGAALMNAGGAFGQIADTITRIHALDRSGREQTIERAEIDFRYRHSGLQGLIITSIELLLPPSDPAALRARLKEVMAYKKSSQPMADNSAGCCFKNPTLAADLKDIAPAGQRVSAGMLIDKAGCKGLRVGGAMVSPRHGNFIVTGPGARAHDVIELMALVTTRVHDAFGVIIEPEVVIWTRKGSRA